MLLDSPEISQDLGATVALDTSDLPADANGQRYRYKGGPERTR